MDKTNIYEALSHLDDQLIADTEKVRQNKKGTPAPIYIRIVKSRGTKIVLAAACLALVIGIGGNALLGGNSKKGLSEEFSKQSLMAVKSSATESFEVMVDTADPGNYYSIVDSKESDYNSDGIDDSQMTALEASSGVMLNPKEYISTEWTSVTEDKNEVLFGFTLSLDAPFYMTCGTAYELQKMEKEGWSVVESESPLVFDMMLRVIGNKADGSSEYRQSASLSLYKQLQKGAKYRIVKTFSVVLSDFDENVTIPYQMSFEFEY